MFSGTSKTIHPEPLFCANLPPGPPLTAFRFQTSKVLEAAGEATIQYCCPVNKGTAEAVKTVSTREEVPTFWFGALSFAVEVSITVGAKDGVSIMEGDVWPYEGGSEQATTKVIEEIRDEAFQFAREFPESSFSIKYDQTVEITRVDR